MNLFPHILCVYGLFAHSLLPGQVTQQRQDRSTIADILHILRLEGRGGKIEASGAEPERLEAPMGGRILAAAERLVLLRCVNESSEQPVWSGQHRRFRERAASVIADPVKVKLSR